MVARTSALDPGTPLTRIVEGYGVDEPKSGILIGFGLLKIEIPAPGGFTVSKNAVLALAAPSLTVTVMVTLPVCPAAGVTVRSRTNPVLLYRNRFPSGTSVWSEEVAVTISSPARVSTSATLNGNGPTEMPASVTLSGI